MSGNKPDIEFHFSKKFEFKSLVNKDLKCSQPFENLPWEVSHTVMSRSVFLRFYKHSKLFFFKLG